MICQHITYEELPDQCKLCTYSGSCNGDPNEHMCPIADGEEFPFTRCPSFRLSEQYVIRNDNFAKLYEKNTGSRVTVTAVWRGNDNESAEEKETSEGSMDENSEEAPGSPAD